jgi:hypothetical protein
MRYKSAYLAVMNVICAVSLVACSTTPPAKSVEPINYGTSGVGPITADQTRGLLNCYLAGESATKIVELRGEGKSNDEIIKYYSAVLGKGWMQLIYDLLPVIAKDNPAAPQRLEYGRNVYGRCLGAQFNPKLSQIAEYCYQQNQFLHLAFAFRNQHEPMETVYTKMNARGDARVITDALLARAKEVSMPEEGNFRLKTYYGCLGHPDKAPVDK